MLLRAKDTGYLKGDFISKQDFMDIMEELKVIAPYLKTPDQTFLAAKSGVTEMKKTN
jgi:hypothetical protein